MSPNITYCLIQAGYKFKLHYKEDIKKKFCQTFSKFVCPVYQEALEKAGYKFKLHYKPQAAKNRTKNRNRKKVSFTKIYKNYQ